MNNKDDIQRLLKSSNDYEEDIPKSSNIFHTPSERSNRHENIKEGDQLKQ